MIILVAITSAIAAVLIWNAITNESRYLNYQIKKSDNKTFGLKNINSISSQEIIDFIDDAEINNKPILLHLYTSWCKICKKQLPAINEIARKFQNTDLRVIFIAIDNGITEEKTYQTLSPLKNIYFQPLYLENKANFKEMLRTKTINYRNKIPFTVLIDKDSKIITKFSGFKSFKYINRRVIKSLFSKDLNEDI